MARRKAVWIAGLALCCLSIKLSDASEPQLHTGTVVSASAGKIVLKDEAGKDQSFQVESTAKITVNGKPGRLEDLELTMPVQVAMDENGKVLAVSTIDMHKRFPLTNSVVTMKASNCNIT
jgi:hypothetical protein